MIDEYCAVYPTEFLNKLCPGGMSPHVLELKVNSPVILLRNILPSSGLCNGTRLICKRFFRNLIECVIAVGHKKGQHVLIPRISLRPSDSTGYPFQFKRKQFPLKLSFAMKINKAQGQTLSRVMVFPPRSCFSHGQLYVALSRARKSANVGVIMTRDGTRSLKLILPRSN
ncbi:ATP-dependent DNA helicase PIF6-like [Chenopodium quinoa]|uniref:ATP-dependent DNA helicase PIF6-like n=1 Tax=Chenopodium quinoa TaxID=63459 RepID=UPI000B78485D|nr:ATP-dependent DNA helicase PIF6-like [Chenopodium quinoa]